jgi:hypothetical protein
MDYKKNLQEHFKICSDKKKRRQAKAVASFFFTLSKKFIPRGNLFKLNPLFFIPCASASAK